METASSSVLLRWRPQFRALDDGSFVQDFSAAFFMVEQLIASGSLYVVTDDSIFSEPEVWDRIPRILQDRIRRVKSEESSKMASALIAPILDEVGATGLESAILHSGGIADETLREPIAWIYFELPNFLLACREKLHLDFPLEKVLIGLNILLSKMRSPEARANIATLLGVFNSYRVANIDGIEAVSDISSGDSLRLLELFEDELYRKMSSKGALMGIPARVRRASLLISRLARDVAKSQAFKPVVNLTSKAVTAATRIPLPDSEIGALIAKGGFLPPIVSLARPQAKAEETYRSVLPPVLPHPRLKLHGV